MNNYDDYYITQDVKYYMFTSVSQLPNTEEFLIYKNFDEEHLNKLEELMLNNTMIYNDIKDNIISLLSFLRNNIYISIISERKKYQKRIDKLLRIAMEIDCINKEEFYLNQFKIRTNLTYSDDFFLMNEEICIDHLKESIRFDETFVCYLDPTLDLKLQNDELILDQFFIWSLNYFYNDNKELFKDKRVLKNIKKNLLRLMNPNEAKQEIFTKETLEEIEKNSKTLLKKLEL